MENYSSDTTERVRLWFDEWNQAYADFNGRRAGCDKLAVDSCQKSQRRSACEAAERDRCYAHVGAADNMRPPPPDLYLVHVQFESIPDPEAKERLKGIGTRLQLSNDEVDELAQWGRELLRTAKPYRDLVDSLHPATATLRAQPLHRPSK